MAVSSTYFEPRSNSFKALLDKIYEIKFSRHVPLTMILLFAVFAVWRTNHYVAAQLQVGLLVSGALAICIEMAMLAAGASCFISLREAYVKELRGEDADRSKLGVWASFIMLGVTTIALLVLAAADGYLESAGSWTFVILMLLIQFVQSCAIVVFINLADLEERQLLRDQHKAYMLEMARKSTQEREAAIIKQAKECPYCHREVHINNRQRHMSVCPMKPI